MREEFESWMTESGREFSVNVVNDRLGLELSYVPFQAEIAWSSWKASRAALCVELPSRMNGEVLSLYDIGFNDGIDIVIDCIEDAGVSHK